ncbi:MAG: thioredoxin domain-containing protein [Clostridiaceae bacterium]|jgi:uncharacterized protein YyaL (SSP411 family)|nr:thioredoxin domain-containing protein [Clostridiaceae bacterium]
MSTNKQANRLIHEESPYLLQHAYNPVDWFPWGKEAFAKAKTEDKPIFLSIGYSTCHWCHVMERESFEDGEVADLLNRHFVSIKVDREERPDIDSIYMSVCQAMTGHGGWPLTVFMTPDAKPFYTGTYFPKTDRLGMPGLLTILKRVHTLWTDRRKVLTGSAEKVVEAMGERVTGDTIMDHDELITRAYEVFRMSFDNAYGGFGSSPKFPTPHNLVFLLRYWYVYKDNVALSMAEKTLDAMYRGGIFDHIGFGFSRYSTDNKWLVPHFEKMLYDNALLAMAYLEVYRAVQKEKYAHAAKQVFTYVLRDMTSPEGAFWPAEDADSEGEEGKFYLWTLDEVIKVLGDKDGERFAGLFDITERGNFEGKNIPNRINIQASESDMEFIERCRERLFRYREQRTRPFRDDKVMTSWNGLMIAAMAMGGRILDDARYTEAAEKACRFIMERLVREDGRLMTSWRDGSASIPAYADDYTFLIWGLVELYETTYKPEYLIEALELNDDLLKLFWDGQDGGLFLYGDDAEKLIMRPKEVYDGAMPSANSAAALNFLRLSQLTGSTDLSDLAQRLFDAFNREVSLSPHSHAFFLSALLFFKSKPREVIIAADTETEDVPRMLRIINKSPDPFVSSILYTDKHRELAGVIPSIDEYRAIDGRPTAYICRDFACQQPITDIQEFEKCFTQGADVTG